MRQPVVNTHPGQTHHPAQTPMQVFQVLHPLNSTWEMDVGSSSGAMVLRCRSGEQQLQLTGSMLRARTPQGADVILFTGNPIVDSLGELHQMGLRLCDFPTHDAMPKVGEPRLRRGGRVQLSQRPCASTAPPANPAPFSRGCCCSCLWAPTCGKTSAWPTCTGCAGTAAPAYALPRSIHHACSDRGARPVLRRC